MDAQDTPHLREKSRETRSTLTPTQFHPPSADAAIDSSNCSDLHLPICYLKQYHSASKPHKRSSAKPTILTRTAQFKPPHPQALSCTSPSSPPSPLSHLRPLLLPQRRPRAATRPPARRPTSATPAPCSAATAPSRLTPPPHPRSSRSSVSLCRTSPRSSASPAAPSPPSASRAHLGSYILAAIYSRRCPDFCFLTSSEQPVCCTDNSFSKQSPHFVDDIANYEPRRRHCSRLHPDQHQRLSPRPPDVSLPQKVSTSTPPQDTNSHVNSCPGCCTTVSSRLQ